jgi:hypothetical protein
VKTSVFRIRICFYADTDPVFYLNADPDPGSHTNADPDPDPGQTLPSEKMEFDMKNILCVANMPYNIST